MTKLKYDENSFLAEYYEKTNIDGDILIHKDGRRTYLLNQNTLNFTKLINLCYNKTVFDSVLEESKKFHW